MTDRVDVGSVTVRLRDVLFVDVETSGLHPGAYPIEIGWCPFDGVARSSLLSRPPSWSDDDWTEEAEALHGISRSRLQSEGVSADDVVFALDMERTGRIMVSDAPNYDGHWLSMLYRQAGRETSPAVFDVSSLVRGLVTSRRMSPDLGTASEEALRRGVSEVHRAGPDAGALEAFVRALGANGEDVVALRRP